MKWYHAVGIIFAVGFTWSFVNGEMKKSDTKLSQEAYDKAVIASFESVKARLPMDADGGVTVFNITLNGRAVKYFIRSNDPNNDLATNTEVDWDSSRAAVVAAICEIKTTRHLVSRGWSITYAAHSNKGVYLRDLGPIRNSDCGKPV